MTAPRHLRTSYPVSLRQLREESAGINKALRTQVTQYRSITGTELTIDEPRYDNHVRYDTRIIDGMKICFVDYQVKRIVSDSSPARYWTSGGFYAWYE